MEITFFGGAGEVGRSCIMIKSDDTKILLDAGIKLGEHEEYPTISDEELKTVSGIFISHAHLDHCGYLPHVYSAGYKGLVYATKPTIELVNVLLRDYMHISEPKNVTKAGFEAVVKGEKIIEYDKPFKFKNFTIKMVNAGHILGSAIICVSDGKSDLAYTGDISLIKSKLLNGADLKNVKVSNLIMESTYGGEKDVAPNREDTLGKMINSMKETILAGGKVIIPSFAVGKGEELLLLLDDYVNSGRVPKVPIYVDGMINKAMRIHRHNVIYCREELQSRILMSDYDPFRSPNFFPVEKKELRSKIASSEESCIIVTTSGMMVGGPILYYFKKLAGDPMNKLIIVGYQGKGTMGRQIQEGAKEVKINGAKVKIELKVETYHMHGHADRAQLERVPSRIEGLKRIFVVHGEEEKPIQLIRAFEKKFETIAPKNGESFII